MSHSITSRNGARDEDAKVILAQIGKSNLMAISGFRYIVEKDGVRLPVGAGYSVKVTYEDDDTYTVTREYKRGTYSVKGERKDVYCDELGDVAYYASCFRSHDTF